MLAFLLPLLLGALPAHADEATALGEDIAAVARRYRETRPRLRINACNGLVEDILRDAGLDMRGGVKSLHEQMKEKGWLHRRKMPLPGDIAFFDKTYDYNRDGKQNDLLTHIAVVISVDRDGTVNMVHRGSSGIRPLTLNLYHPSVRRADNGKALNSWLGKPGFAREGHKLAGELWTDWASPTLQRRRPTPSVARRPEPKPEPRQAVVRSATPERSRIDLPLSLDDPAFVRAWEGKRMRSNHLDGHSCQQMWFLRNAVFARHGYDFKGQARRIFDAVPAYRADPRVHWDTAARHMSRRDKKNVAALLEREKRCR